MFRFFKDSDELTEVAWYKVPNDRPFFPLAHLFGSWEWEDENRPGHRQPGTMFQGEDEGSDRLRRGQTVIAPIPFTGHYCGTEAQWQGEMTLDQQTGLGPNQFPVCCSPEAYEAPPTRGLALWLDAATIYGGAGSQVVLWPARAPTTIDGVLPAGGDPPTLFRQAGAPLGVAVSFTESQSLNLTRVVGVDRFWSYAVAYSGGEDELHLGQGLGFPLASGVSPGYGMGYTFNLPLQRWFRDFRPDAFHIARVTANMPQTKWLAYTAQTPPRVQLVAWPGPLATPVLAAGAFGGFFSVNQTGPGAGGGLVGEVLVYEEQPTLAEHAAILSYLSLKWGIPLT